MGVGRQSATATHPLPSPPLEREGVSATYLKLIGAMFMWGGTWIAGRVVAQELTAPLAVPAIRFLLAGLALAGFALASEGRIPRPETGSEWGIVTGLAIGGTALAFTWFADGVRRIGAAKASVFVNLVPVFAVLQAAVLLDERLGMAVLGGGLLVIAGVWLTTQFSERTA